MKCDRKPWCIFAPSYQTRMGVDPKRRSREIHFCDACREFILVKLTPQRKLTEKEAAEHTNKTR